LTVQRIINTAAISGAGREIKFNRKEVKTMYALNSAVILILDDFNSLTFIDFLVLLSLMSQ
jgi:hypothetical protein